MTEQVKTSGKSPSSADVAGGGAGDANAPSPVAGWVSFNESDENAARDFWNSISDEWNQWEALSRDEQVNTAQAFSRHREAERERCARVADEAQSCAKIGFTESADIDWLYVEMTAKEIAAAIRLSS